MRQMRTIFHFFPADPSVDHSKYMFVEPSLCREVCVPEGMWSTTQCGSLLFVEAQNTQSRIVLVDKLFTDFEDFKKKYPEDGMGRVFALVLCC